MRYQIVCLLSALAFLSALSVQGAEQVTISEFLASNASGLRDEDGSYSDWIELRNSGTTAVNLDGWYLTDSAGNLTKWRIPATNIAAGGFLIVFADNKNRSVPGAPLHTSFNLSAGGEYLALVKPDGVTIASQFSPSYPGQAPNVSYGVGTLTTNSTVINSNTLVRVRVPGVSEGTNWTTLDYDDSAWTAGTNGIGYGATNSIQVDYTQSVLPTAPVVYYRLNETSGGTAANIGSGGAAQNGTYNGVVLGNPGPRPPAFNGFEANNNAATFTGANYVGGPVSFFNNRSSFTVGGWIRPTSTPAARTGLFGQNDCVEFGFISGTTLECWTPGGGSLTAVPYPFPLNEWHHVLGVADGATIRIFIDGVQAGSGGAATANYGSSTFGFNIGGGGVQDASGNFFPGQIDEVVAYHRALSNTEILSLYRAGTNGVGTPAAAFVRTDVRAAMSNINASAYVRLPFTVANPTNVTQLTLRMRYDDGFAAFINGREVARVNAPETLNFNSAATNGHSPLVVDEFRFDGSMLVAGTNVLAIQGLNLAAGDEDFLLATELSVSSALGAGSVALYFTVPTPGAVNEGGVANPGPAILSPAHAPLVPKDNEDLTVTAQIAPTFFPVSSVVMRYRVMFGSTNQVTMFDDGAHGDGAANDGVWGASIPASAATNGQMIRWYFSAVDTAGNTSRWPIYVNQLESAEYLGTMVDEPNVTSKLPIYHLFVAPQFLSAVDTEGGGRVSVFYDGEFYDNVRMSLRGNTSASQVKKSHRFEFNREHAFRHHPDHPRIRKTSLMAEFLDPAYLRQHLSFWLLEQMGVPSPFFYPVRAQMNGAFYALTYHNDVIDEEQVERMGYDPRGTLYKAAGNILPSQSSTGVFEKKTEPLNDHTEYQTFVRAINETNTVAGRRAAAFDMMDIPEVINYLAGARWASENDDVWANMSIYRDTYGDQMWRIIPFDMNASWGQRYGGISPLDSTNDACKSHPLYGGATTIACDGSTYNRIYDVVVALPELRQMLLRRQRTVLDRWVLEPGVEPQSRLLETHIKYMTNLIWTEAFLDRAKWGYSTWTASNKPLTNAVDELFNQFINPRRNHWNATHSITNTAKPIGINRTDNAGIPLTQPISAALYVSSLDFNPSSANQAQEYLALTNPNPFAIDISRWKLDGAINFTFKEGTIVPSNSVVYVSPDIPAFRSRTTGPRGGQGLFVVGPYDGQLSARGETIRIVDNTGRLVQTNLYAGNPSAAQQFLRITEIMYAPAITNTGSPYGREEFEYIELKNTGPAALNLIGVRFVAGIDFAFTTNSAITNLAPGQVVVLVKNAAAFVSRYGGTATIAGSYSNILDNSGERIRLEDAVGEEILEFTYNNSWYPITDGLGFSLVIVNENAPFNTWDEKESWRPSGVLNGSAGENDPAAPTFAPVLVNEVLANSDPGIDSIELWNTGTNAADISHWWISDDFFTPQKYRIPASTTIPAGGYLVLNETQFNPGGAGFSFRSSGDEAYLFSGDAGGNLSGYFHGFVFDASEPNVSFGRYLTSDGDEHFVAQSANTFGGTNAAPKVGPIVISEIMYHPPDLVTGDDSDSEYIELHNISGSSVALFDTTNRWRLDDAVNFSFSTNTTIPAGGFLVVVGFDPATNTTALAAFRAKYGLAPSVSIVGPWSGQLDNSEDDVELKKPDTSVPTNITSVLVEKVHYHDVSPWQGAADGFGPALIRIVEADFGNDATNWLAGAPTPGAASTIAPPPVITSQPADAIVVIGNATNFTVVATGGGLAFQWFRNGTAVPGATGAVLTLQNVQLEQAGSYSVIALSGGGATLSSNAQLTVLSPVAVIAQPLSQIVAPGTNVTISVGAIGNGTLRYQWRFEGNPIPNATNSSYGFVNANLGQHHGNFSVVVTDDVSMTVSSNALIFIRIPPHIVVQPAPQTVAQGQTARFSIMATGAPPINYRWLRNGQNYLSNAGPTLIITNCQINGTFRVVVTNLAGTSNSLAAALTVLPDSDGDGLPDAWETNHFGNLTAGNANTDSDGDGMLDRDEFSAGTIPTNAASVLKIILSTTNRSVLQFVAQTNLGYTVQYQTNLDSGFWSSLTNIGIGAQVRTMQVTAPYPVPEPERYYRVVTPPDP